MPEAEASLYCDPPGSSVDRRWKRGAKRADGMLAGLFFWYASVRGCRRNVRVAWPWRRRVTHTVANRNAVKGELDGCDGLVGGQQTRKANKV